MAATSDSADAPRLKPRLINVTFNAPVWLRGLGHTCWLVVGVAVVVLGALKLLSMTSTIVMPLIVALVLAAVCAPAVSKLEHWGIPRGIGTALFVVVVLAVSALLGYAIVRGVISESGPAVSHLEQASSNIANWAEDQGVDPNEVNELEVKAKSTVSHSVESLARGTADGVRGLAGSLFFLGLTALSLIFILKDAPSLRNWTEGKMGVPQDVARTITGSVVKSLRGYFVGMTILSVLTTVIISIAAMLLDVPLVATIAVVTFICVYIPYIGAVIAALFTMLVTLATGSDGTVIAMLIILLAIYAFLHPIIQPLIFGSTLDIHPLVALVATIAGGSVFGVLGLVLTAPLVAAITHISVELVESRSVTSEEPGHA